MIWNVLILLWIDCNSTSEIKTDSGSQTGLGSTLKTNQPLAMEPKDSVAEAQSSTPKIKCMRNEISYIKKSCKVSNS